MMSQVSFVIPWKPGSPERERIFLWSSTRLGKLFPLSELSIGENHDEAFNRSAAVNLGAKRARGKYLAIVDADTVWNPYVLGGAVASIRYGKAPWVIPYKMYRRTTREAAFKIMGLHPTVELEPDHYSYEMLFPYPPEGYDEPVSGIVVVEREAFLDAGGMCEGFRGWGFEDRALVNTLDTLVGPHVRTAGDVIHLWHPEPPATTTNQPFHEENRRLAEQFRMAAGDPSRIRSLNS